MGKNRISMDHAIPLKPLTKKQEKVLLFIDNYEEAFKRKPTLAIIGTAVGMGLSSTHQMLKRLERLGRLERVPGSPRNFRLKEKAP